jgi:hypothetical protein
VNADLRKAERELTGLEKCCGLCSCKWQFVFALNHANRSSDIESSRDYKSAWKDDGVGTIFFPLIEGD